ncbi:putative arginine/ornithine antiporter [Actinobacillus equuli]|nr:putative arginine/ornithine antiporter [Actinobacillus equuli]
MLITLWVFTGVEGASVLSAHAKRKVMWVWRPYLGF